VQILVVFEKVGDSYSAYSPDLPGCVATGESREETAANMHQALELHVQGMIEEGEPIPDSASFAEVMVIA